MSGHAFEIDYRVTFLLEAFQQVCFSGAGIAVNKVGMRSELVRLQRVGYPFPVCLVAALQAVNVNIHKGQQGGRRTAAHPASPAEHGFASRDLSELVNESRELGGDKLQSSFLRCLNAGLRIECPYLRPLRIIE
ncbi:hypothetical protein D3C73_1321970 [compost metagenome]